MSDVAFPRLTSPDPSRSQCPVGNELRKKEDLPNLLDLASLVKTVMP